MTILTEKLYEQVLIDPAVKDGADTLYVVSGYVSPYLISQQFQDLKKHGLDISIHAVVGMVALDGIPKLKHLSFKNLMGKEYKEQFSCRYITETPPIHTKLYIWCKKNQPIKAFMGSANFSKNGFGVNKTGNYEEILMNCDINKAMAYYQASVTKAVLCTDPLCDQHVIDIAPVKKNPSAQEKIPDLPIPATIPTIHDMVILSFLSKREGYNVPTRSSLNWGQRPELNRDPNQAYIPVPSIVQKAKFFPPLGVYFKIYTDDGKLFLASRAQAKGKAIHTPENNSLFGIYFRERLGVPSGEIVTRKHLESYGRTDVTFIKYDDENYEMDFSVPKK